MSQVKEATARDLQQYTTLGRSSILRNLRQLAKYGELECSKLTTGGRDTYMYRYKEDDDGEGD